MRVDGVAHPYTVLPHYDSMVAAHRSWRRSRAVPAARGVRSMSTVSGHLNDDPFHLRLLENERFVAGDYDATS